MSWKCVLVGLALVLPGTLLSVEGRYSEETRGSKESKFLDTLLQYFEQDRLLTRRGYNAQKDETPFEKKSETGASILSDGQDTQPVAASSEDNPAPPPVEVQKSNPQLPGNDVKEINTAVEGPKASRLQQSRGGSDKHSSGWVPAGSVAFITIVAGCTVLAAVGIVGAGVCWYKYHKSAKAASEVEYPAYGVTGPTKDRLPSPGDRKLAQSAQMYHYQHQKQQMIAMEKANGDMKHDASDDESEEENPEGDYTVYECPGLAPTGEMEVKNPLFRGDETPSTPANDEGHQPADDQ